GFGRAHGAEGFLVAVAVQQRALRHRLERQRERALPRLARQEFLEQEAVGGEAARVLAPHQRRDLVAEAEQAAPLEADDRDAPLHQGRRRGDATLGLLARLLDQPDREEGAAAAERAAAARRFRQEHAIAAGGEHGERGRDVLRLEVAVEGVGEERDFTRGRATDALRLANALPAPARPLAAPP